MEQFHDISDENLNISDVIEVIQTTDPGFVESNGQVDQEMVDMGEARLAQPYVEIVEQPASKALRFRYECEGRSAGSIPGANSSPENKTFPTIRIVGYKGRAIVVVSCVTKDLPYRPHPHNLVGKEICKRGVCTLEISSENMTVTFANLGIQCVKKKDIEEALKIREEIRVDPFRTGFEHKKQPTTIDLNAVRLCFQVFLEGSQKGKFTHPLSPVVSDPIFDKKAMSDLVINKLSHCNAPVAGGMGMILLCEKVAKEDIQIRFFEEIDGHTTWEGFGDFQPSQVHKQTAIAFRTPSYCTQEIEQPVQVYIQLRRPSDGVTSDPLPFEMLPLGTDDRDSFRRKRQKFNNSPKAIVLRHIQAEAKNNAAATYQPMQYFNIIKPEPTEAVPPFGGVVTTTRSYSLHPMGTSPQPQSNVQMLRPQLSPGRTPSPMEYNPYASPVMQPQLSPQYQPSSSNMTQQPSVGIHVPQQCPFLQENNLQDADQLITLNKVTSEQQNTGLQPIYNDDNLEKIDVATGLGIDGQQYFNLSLNSADLAEFPVFDTTFSTNLLSGLSISEYTKDDGASENVNLEANCVEDNNIMTDSYTNLTKNTIQELYNLNDIYKPNRSHDN